MARLRSVVVSYPPTEAIELRRVEIGGFDAGRSVDDWGYPVVRFHDVEPCEHAFLGDLSRWDGLWVLHLGWELSPLSRVAPWRCSAALATVPICGGDRSD